MKVLQVKKFKSSQMQNVFDNVKTFELEDKAFDSGAFGEVYFCKSLNGKTLSVSQVVKVLIDDGSGSAKSGIRTIQNLQDKIILQNEILKSSGQKSIDQISCLFALPQLSFEGNINGKTVFGYSQNKIDTKEYVLFKDFFDEPDFYKRKKNREDLQRLSIEDRLKLGFDLAEGFQALRDMAYIHADLNPKNLFIRFNPPSLVLIDYDSGVVVNNQIDKADTFGQLGGWIAPEIQSQLLKNNSGVIKVDLNTDTWAVAVAIHYLIFLFHPLDFLKIRGKREMEQYFNKNQWPEFDTNDKNFRQELNPIYQRYLKIIQSIPSSVLKGLKVTINEGYFNPGRRVTYRQWLKILSLTSFTQPIIKPGAEIISFYSEKIKINLGEKINLYWEIKNAVKIKLNGKELPAEQKTAVVGPGSDTEYVLEAFGANGAIEKNTIKIVVKNKKSSYQNNPAQHILSTRQAMVLPSLLPQRLALCGGLLVAFALTYYFWILKLQLFNLFLPPFSIILLLFYYFKISYDRLKIVSEKKNILSNYDQLENRYRELGKEINETKSGITEAEEKINKKKRKLGKDTLLLKGKEKNDITGLQKKYSSRIDQARQKISEAKKLEEEAIKTETDRLYEKIIKSELYKYLIIDADIEGIQIIFKGILTFNGIFTAADIVDVDKNGNILKMNGEWVRLNALTYNKVKKLWEWKQKVVNDIKRKFPQALTVEQKKQIRQKHSNMIDQLMKEESTLDQNLKDEINAVSNRVSQQIIDYIAINIEKIEKDKDALEKRLKALIHDKLSLESELLQLKTNLDAYKQVNINHYLLKIIGI